MFRWWFSQLRQRSLGRQRRSMRPRLETLEDRTVPTVTFFWDGAAGAAWNNAANWQRVGGAAGDWPNATDHVVIFDGNKQNTDVTLPVAATVGKIETKNGYDKEIRLEATLTVEKVGAVGEGGSSFASEVKIAPQNNTANFVLKGAYLTVGLGQLGSTANKSEIQVINRGFLDITLTGGAFLGMNLVVGTAGGGNGIGFATLKDANAGSQGRHLTVWNDADITLNNGSTLDLQGRDGDGWILDDGQTSGTIVVKPGGVLSRSGADEVKVALPILIESAGINKGLLSLDASNTILTVTSRGNATTSDKSLLVNGSVSFNEDNASLNVEEDISFSGGNLFAGTSVNGVTGGVLARISANHVEFTNGGMLSLRDVSGSYSTVSFDLFGQNAKVALTNGRWVFDLEGGGGVDGMCDRVLVSGGSLDIAATNTTLDAAPVGNAGPWDGHRIIDVYQSTINGDFANKPADYDCFVTQVGGGQWYRVERKAPKGGGKEPGEE